MLKWVVAAPPPTASTHDAAMVLGCRSSSWSPDDDSRVSRHQAAVAAETTEPLVGRRPPCNRPCDEQTFCVGAPCLAADHAVSPVGVLLSLAHRGPARGMADSVPGACVGKSERSHVQLKWCTAMSRADAGPPHCTSSTDCRQRLHNSAELTTAQQIHSGPQLLLSIFSSRHSWTHVGTAMLVMRHERLWVCGSS